MSSTPTTSDTSLLRNPSSSLLQPPRVTTATTSSPPPSTSSARFSSVPQFTPPPFTTPPYDPTLPISNLLPLFSKHGAPTGLRGTVRIKVEATTFYCHKEVLGLASPFFESVVCGGWRETEPRRRKSAATVTVTAPEAEESARAARNEKRSSATSIDDGEDVTATLEALSMGDVMDDGSPALSSDTATAPSLMLENDQEDEEDGDLSTPSIMASSVRDSMISDSDDEDEDEDDEWIECRLRLKEESASSFQDLLCHIYPRLECTISWQNASDLCKMSSLFDIPSLRNACIAFLLPSAAGRPTLGMKIAEENVIPELYKESSRYILDNFTVWPQEELAMLSQATLLKLERRRSWFLERLLKLGLIQTSKDYVCQPTCPDPNLCARLVDEKWKTAWSSAFRFGTPQPSIIYRSLRNLEPSLSSPALHLPHTACQSHAKLYVADLFDRMFQQSIVAARNWGLASTAVRSSDAVAKNSARYFLSIEMDGVPKKVQNFGQHNSVAAPAGF